MGVPMIEEMVEAKRNPLLVWANLNSKLTLYHFRPIGVILKQGMMPCYDVVDQSQLLFQSKLLLCLDWIPDGPQLPIMNLNL